MRRRHFALLLGLAIAGFLLWPRPATSPPPPAPVKAAGRADAVPGPGIAVPTAPAAVPAGAKPVLAPPALPAADAGPRAARPDAGAPGLFGPLVALGQGYAFSEALQKNAANADAYVDKLCADSARLRERGPMRAPETRARDAAAFMAPLMDYEKPLDQPPGRLHLSDELRGHLTAGAGTDWGAKITAADLAGLDFSWMAALGQFDHWSLLGAGRLQDYQTDDFFSAPIPNYLPLQQWSKLRFALARRRGDFAAASAEVRHLAELLRTQDLLIAEAVAVAIFKIDASARDAAFAAGADVSGWPALDGELLDTQRHVAFASMYFTYPGVKPETLRRAVACVPLPCVALVEGAGANRVFGSYASDNLALVSELAAANGCEKAVIDLAVNAKELPASTALEQLGVDVDAQIPRQLGPLP